MKIGIVTAWQERGAAYVSRQYQQALAAEHEIFIYARGGEGYAIGNPNWDSPAVTWGKKIPLGMPLAIDLRDFKKWIKKNRLDIVFFNEQQWWDPVISCQELGVKTGAYIDYYTAETVPFFAIYDFLICNTKRHHSAFAWHPQAFYVPWGTDTKIFRPTKLGPVDPGKVVFFHSAGVSPERKGSDLIIPAFNKVSGPAKLIIHAQTDLKSKYPELKEIISNLEKEERLLIINKTVSAPGLYHLGDVYVYPSRLDGIGLSLPEALACGLPAITSDNPPMNEFISPQSGRLVKIDRLHPRNDGYFWPLCEPNLESLAAELQFYVDNQEKLGEYKAEARRYAETNLDWLNNSRGLAKLFKEAAERMETEKNIAIEAARHYENKRSNWRTRLYRLMPWLFLPFSWLWPIIRLRYIKK